MALTKIVKLERHRIESAIDQLGRIQAQIADLQNAETELKEYLGSLLPGPYEGRFFAVNVSKYSGSKLDMKAVKAKLSAQFIRAHTTTYPVTRVTVTAR